MNHIPSTTPAFDPDANLSEQLELVTEAIGLNDPTEQAELDRGDLLNIVDQYFSLAKLVEALNEHIMNGCRLPEVWQRQQDNLSSEYFKAELMDHFPWLMQIGKDGQPTEFYEEPSGADVIDALSELWTEVINGPTTKDDLVPLSLGERRMLVAMMEKFRENIGEDSWHLEGFGEDDIYSGSFDLIQKMDSQPQPPQPILEQLQKKPVRFRTEDGYTFTWDYARREWSNNDMTFKAGGWSWWPVDIHNKPVPGDLLHD